MAERVLALYTLCVFLCSLHGVVTARSHPKESLHLTYFAHEILDLGAANSTVLVAAGNGSAPGWGTIMVFDNPMKSGNTSDSLLLGSITGTLALTTTGTTGGNLMNAQHIFTEGSKYNGSSLTVIGTILSPTPPFECIVPGGTGLLRGYSGYAILSEVGEVKINSHNVYQWDIYVTRKI